jgi:hypothetical protein
MSWLEKFSRDRFANRVNREIHGKIFVQLRGEANNGYPFGTDRELLKQGVSCELDAKLHIDQIALYSAQLPQAYGKAFRYIAYRDLDEQAKMFLMLARRQIQPVECDPRFVATHA